MHAWLEWLMKRAAPEAVAVDEQARLRARVAELEAALADARAGLRA
jgi:hypothetical protein